MNNNKDIDFWYYEWQLAKKDGNTNYAESCKEKHKEMVMALIKKSNPHFLYLEQLSYLPPICLN